VFLNTNPITTRFTDPRRTFDDWTVKMYASGGLEGPGALWVSLQFAYVLSICIGGRSFL